MLGLRNGCNFLEATAALYHRLWQEGLDEVGRARLTPLVTLLALPGSRATEEERDLVLTSFRKGRFQK